MGFHKLHELVIASFNILYLSISFNDSERLRLDFGMTPFDHRAKEVIAPGIEIQLRTCEALCRKAVTL